MTSTPTQESIFIRLKEHHARMQSLVDLIGERRRLDGDDRAQAQYLLKQIKDKLAYDYKHGISGRGQTGAFDDEQYFLFPAVQEAVCAIHVRVNTIPGQSWVSELYSAQGLLSHYMCQLESNE